jgi:hypothetical protein
VCTSCPSLPLSFSQLLQAPIQSVEERGGAGVGREKKGGERGREDVERGRDRKRFYLVPSKRVPIKRNKIK